MASRFDKKIDRWATGATKWAMTKIPGSPQYTEVPKEDVIPMWVADMDFETAPSVIEALKERIEHPILGYSVLNERYVNAIASWQKDHYGTEGVKEEHILYQNSVLGGVCSAISVYTQPGDWILTGQATYVGFQGSIRNLGRNVAFSPMVKDENGIYRMDFEDMEKQIVEKHIPMMIFCSPHNPTGRVWERWEIEKVVELCDKYNVFLFSDEIWADFMTDPASKHIPTQSVSETAKRICLASYAPSKTFNLAGLIGSYTICYNPVINARIKRQGESTHYNNANVLSLAACTGAYEGGDEYVQELMPYLRRNQEYMVNFLNSRKGIDAYLPQGTYLLWVDVAGCGMDMDTVMKKLNETGVIVNDGRPFQGPTHLRINVACPYDSVVEACRRLETVFPAK